MRFFSVVTALLVSLALYLMVFERDRVIAFASSGTDDGSAPASEEESLPVERVSVVALASSAEMIEQAVLVRGRTEAARQVDVRAETSGAVVSDPLRRGASVEEGELLCRIDPGTRGVSLDEELAALGEASSRIPEAEARVSEAQAALKEAEINLNAASELAKGGFASETRLAAAEAAQQSALAGLQAAVSQLEGARAGIRSADAAVAGAEKEIERLEILAPFSGLLESDTAELGSLLQPGSLCATIIQLNPIKLVGFVPETDVDKVRVGARAGARLATGRQVAGRVTFLSRSADPATRTFRVDVEVPNGNLSIRDGQTAEIVIEAEGELAHLLPASALTLDDGGALGVRTVEAGDLAGFRPVNILRDTVNGIFVSGLGNEASVIVVGQEYVTEGVLVAPTYREAGE